LGFVAYEDKVGAFALIGNDGTVILSVWNFSKSEESYTIPLDKIDYDFESAKCIYPASFAVPQFSLDLKVLFDRFSPQGRLFPKESKFMELLDLINKGIKAVQEKGIDKQLDKAIEVIMEQLKTYNKTVPPIPKFPIKNK
jgi:hypothetical protein